MKRLFYWLISLAVVIGIFVIFFGVVGHWILESQVDHVKVFATVTAAVGLILVMFSIHSPKILWSAVLAKPESKEVIGSDRVGAFILGLSFMIGALIYSKVGMVYSFGHLHLH